MYSEKLLEHFRNPRNAGELDPPAVVVDVSNPACGDMLRLSALVEGGRVTQVAFKVRGCTASIACGSALTEWLEGRAADELGQLTPADIEDAVGGLMAESKHAAQLCMDGVRALLKAMRS